MDQVYNDERMVDVPALDSQMENEHRHRYRTAARFARGKRVLDAACGSGYGSAILAEQAASVVGIDYSSAVIGYCSKTYQKENLSFQTMSAADLTFPDSSFDMVVSFETVEHLTQEDQTRFLAGIRRVLAEDGLLIISSPNKGIWEGTVNRAENRHHLHELTQPEFQTLLSRHFRHTAFFYQSYPSLSLITPRKAREALQVHCSENYTGADPAAYLIAVCSNRPLEEDLSGIYLQETAQAIAEKQLGYVSMYLYCDCGRGFTEEDKLSAPVRFSGDGTYRVEFTLRKDACALRFDPGEQKCTLRKLRCSDPQIRCTPQNGFCVGDDIIFPSEDPILLLEGTAGWKQGQTLTFFFEGRSGTFPARAYTAPEADQKGVVPASRYAELAKAYLELEQAYAAAMLKCGREKQLEDALAETRNILAGILTSLSWRVTAPLRKLMEIIRRR